MQRVISLYLAMKPNTRRVKFYAVRNIYRVQYGLRQIHHVHANVLFKHAFGILV